MSDIDGEPTDEIITEVLEIKKNRLLFIKSHLYLEHYLDLAVERYFPRQEHLLDVPYFATDLKLRVLHGCGFLTDVVYLNAKMMNEIRNKYAHKLEPKEEKIGKKIDTMEIPWISEYKLGTMDRFEKYREVAIRTILAIKNAVDENRNTDLYPEISIEEKHK